MRDYRGRDHELLRSTDKRVVLALGDSFTFGTGVDIEDTFMAIAEANCENTIILKAGVPGYNIWHYLAYVEHHVSRLGPSQVLVNVFPENDLSLSIGRTYVTRAGYLARGYRNRLKASLFMNVNQIAFGHSAFFRHLRARGVDFHCLGNVLERLGDRKVASETIGSLARNKTLLHVEMGRADPADGLYACFEEVFAAIKSSLDRRGIGLLVVLLPFRLQVEHELLSRVIPGCREEDYDRRLIHKRMSVVLGQLGIPYIDASMRFEREYRRERPRLFWLIDGHFTEEGNVLMASILRGKV